MILAAGPPTTLDWATFIVGVVGAVGTIAALVVAIWLGLHEVRTFRAEAARREAAQLERDARARRSQAEQVSAITRVLPSPIPGSDNGRGRAAYPADGDVLNASALAIYEAKVDYS